MLRKSLWIFVALLAVSVFVLTGCEQQAKTGAKCSLAAPAKTAPADANAVKTCPMKAKTTCAVKEKAKCVADANVPKSCHKMMCNLGDGKEANNNICCQYKDKKYCFCCEGCKKEFEKNPDKYVGKCK